MCSSCSVDARTSGARDQRRLGKFGAVAFDEAREIQREVAAEIGQRREGVAKRFMEGPEEESLERQTANGRERDESGGRSAADAFCVWRYGFGIRSRSVGSVWSFFGHGFGAGIPGVGSDGCEASSAQRAEAHDARGTDSLPARGTP
jgi:hypothetical protein